MSLREDEYYDCKLSHFLITLWKVPLVFFILSYCMVVMVTAICWTVMCTVLYIQEPIVPCKGGIVFVSKWWNQGTERKNELHEFSFSSSFQTSLQSQVFLAPCQYFYLLSHNTQPICYGRNIFVFLVLII